MALRGFERRLERMVEGAFARVFRSGLRPVELGRRLVREMEDGRTVDVRGHTIVPNAFAVELSAEDHDRFAEIAESLCRELEDAARDQARDEAYQFLGPVEVELVVGRKLKTGAFQITARLREGSGGSGAGSLVLPSGERLALGADPVVIGRMSSCDVTVNDPNVSREHAEVRPSGRAYVVVDLGSTNGVRVNGVKALEHELADGDEIGVGNAVIVFEAS